MFSCPFCPRQFKNGGGLATHQPYCPSNPNKVAFNRSPNAGRKKGCVAWNKGLVGDPRCARPDLKGKLPPAALGQTQETKDKLSAVAKARGLGGYQRGSGRGKKGWYQGYWCDSSYELAWIIYQLDHGISFERNTEKFAYEFEGKTRYWIPDFLLPDGSYVEIKGYEIAQSKAKLASFEHPILLLKEKDLQIQFKYVIEKYGRDYIRLYE